MSRKKTNEKRIYIWVTVIGILSVFIVAGTFGWIIKTKSERRFHSIILGMKGPRDTILEDLVMRPKKVHCSLGLNLKMTCSAEKVDIYDAAEKIKVFEAKKVSIKDIDPLSSPSLIDLRKKHSTFHASIEGLRMSDTLPMRQKMSDPAREISSLIEPVNFDIFIEIWRKGMLSNKVPSIHYRFDMQTSVPAFDVMFSLFGETADRTKILLDENLHLVGGQESNKSLGVVEKKYALPVAFTVKHIDFRFVDRKTMRLLYAAYKYYYQYETTKERQMLYNEQSLGISDPELADWETFRKATRDRLVDAAKEHDNQSLRKLIEKLSKVLYRTGELDVKLDAKKVYTLEELYRLWELKTLKDLEGDAFDISFTTKTNKEKR